MDLLTLPGGAILPVMDNTEQSAWEASEPADRSCIVNSDSGSIWYWDSDNAIAVEIPFGGSPIYTYNMTATIGASSVTLAGLVGATVTKFFRQGMGREVVTSATTNTMQVFFDTTTGTISLATGDEFEDAEWLQIEYKGVPEIGA